MSETERVYSSRQVAARLGLSPAMTRRYAATLEEITGEAVKQHPRDGRQYREDQLEAMVQAKAFVEANPRLSVADALQAALGLVSETVATELSTESETGSQTLETAFARALERSLLPELRELRAEVAALRTEANEARALPPPTPPEPETLPTDDGPLVRAARWLERRLRWSR